MFCVVTAAYTCCTAAGLASQGFCVTRLLEAGQSLGKLDQSFYNKCTTSVTTATGGL